MTTNDDYILHCPEIQVECIAFAWYGKVEHFNR